MVYRIYVEKKPRFAVDGGAVLADLNVALGIKTVENVRIINRYDCEKLPKENFEAAVPTVFSEPPVDEVYYELPKPAADERMFAVEFLPGQFDQRAFRCSAPASALLLSTLRSTCSRVRSPTTNSRVSSTTSSTQSSPASAASTSTIPWK